MIVDAQDIKDEDLLCMAINSSLGLSLISTLSLYYIFQNLLPSKMFDDMKFA